MPKTTTQTVLVPLDALTPNPFNVRLTLTPQTLASLAKSIEARGLIHPILVRPHPNPEHFGQYQIICGERRYAALKLLAERDPERWSQIAVRVEHLDDTAALAAMLQENELRQDWTPYERAVFFRQIYDDKHFKSIRQMAKAFGIGLTTLHRYLRVFDLPASIVDYFRQGRLSVALLEVVMDAPPHLQKELAKHLAESSLNKEQARRLAKQLATTNPASDWIDRLSHMANQHVRLIPQPGAKLKIEICSDNPQILAAELARLAKALSHSASQPS